MTAPNTDARRFEAYLANLAQKVKSLEEASKQPQLGYSSLDDRNVVVTVGGEVRQVWGVQPGGAVGVANFNGPPPPRPNTPDVTGVLGGLDVAWNGELAGELPADFSHITVHAYFVDGFAWSEDNRVGTLFSKGSLIVAPLEVAPHYVRFVAWNTSGKPSEPSYQASGVPLAAVSDETLAGIRSDLAQAARDAAQVEVAGATIGRGQIADQAIDTSKLADGSVSAAQLVDGAVTATKVAFSAREIGALANYYQPAAPTDAREGDTWADSDDSAKLYRWNGTTWALIQDSATALANATAAQTAAANALAAASSAEAKVDGKVTVFYVPDPPAASASHLGDLWIDTNDGNRLARFDGTTWQAVDDARLAAALTAAATAQATADGKIDSYYAATAPPAAGLGVGDLWFDTANGNRSARWDGTQWVNLPIGAPAISASAVTTDKLSANAVTAEKIVALAIGTRELAANSVVAGKIAAEAITAEKLAATSVTAEKIAALAVSADKIAAQAITVDKLAALAVTADKIAANAITASKITAGSINATHLTTSLLLASQITVGTPGAARLELEGRAGSAPGLRLYGTDGNPTFLADASDGDVFIKGQIRSSDSGERLIWREQDNVHDIRFYPATGNNWTRLFTRTFSLGGSDYGAAMLQGPSYNGRRSSIWVTPDQAQMYRGTTDGANDYGGVFIGDNRLLLTYRTTSTADGTQPVTSMQLTSSKAEIAMGLSRAIGVDSGGAYVAHTNRLSVWTLGAYTWRMSYASEGGSVGDVPLFWVAPQNCGFQMRNTGLDVYNPSSGSYLAVAASAFVTKSAFGTKANVEELPWDPERVITGARSRMWEYRDEQRDEHGRFRKARKRFGPMADDLPALLQIPTGIGERVMGVDLVTQVGVLWGASGQQTDRLDLLEARLAALEGRPTAPMAA